VTVIKTDLRSYEQAAGEITCERLDAVSLPEVHLYSSIAIELYGKAIHMSSANVEKKIVGVILF
jgi:hypothetical protein